MDPTRVLIADDHTLVRAGIRSLLDKLSGIEVVAESSNGREVLRLVAEHQPQIVLMDIAMPELNGLEATTRLTELHPDVRVVILSIHSDEEHVFQALRAGASGYLLKGASIEELELAIRSAARGEIFLSPQISRPVIDEYVRRTRASRPEEILSTRQRQVLQLIAEGKTMKQVALDLGISVKTVETHRAQLMDRLNIHDVAGLVRYAIKMRLVKIG
ncbi:MAG TPA: response regulator transcription factor [Pyrinomonadaceae bacterium]|nr:response regulator transcription factor [Pyrinomonadaceae bacterium]